MLYVKFHKNNLNGSHVCVCLLDAFNLETIQSKNLRKLGIGLFNAPNIHLNADRF
jgi:hypothetical protein